MSAVENDPTTLQKHMAGTYHSLRLGIFVIGASLPPVLWIGGRLFDHQALRASMSAYYYSPHMRDTFVGALISIGVALYLYKGFSTRENVALNLAGALAVGVAMVPTHSPDQADGPSLTLHASLAVLFFLCIAYVSIFRASDSLSLVKDPANANKLRTTYRLLGLGMLVSPLVAVVLTFLFQSVLREGQLIFFVEAVAVWMFAAYWLVKSREMRSTGAELLALEGKLRAEPDVAGDKAAPGRLVQVAR